MKDMPCLSSISARTALAIVSTSRQALAQQMKSEQALSAEAGGLEELLSRRQRDGPVGGRGGRSGGGGATAAYSDGRDGSTEDGVLESNIVGYPESDDDDNSNVREVGTTLPTELFELRRQLNFLRNEFSSSVSLFLCVFCFLFCFWGFCCCFFVG